MDVLVETSSTSQDGGDTQSVKNNSLTVKETWTNFYRMGR